MKTTNANSVFLIVAALLASPSFAQEKVLDIPDPAIFIPEPGYYLFNNAENNAEVLTVKQKNLGNSTIVCIEEWDICLEEKEDGIFGVKGDIWLSSDLFVGKKWKDNEGAVTTVTDVDAVVQTQHNKFDHCLELEIYYPPGLLEETEVFSRDYLCSGYGYVKLEAKQATSYTVDLELVKYYSLNSKYVINRDELYGKWEIYHTSVTPNGLPNKEFYTFKSDGTVDYTVGKSTKNYEYLLLPDKIILFREMGITLTKTILSYANNELVLRGDLGISLKLRRGNNAK
jgi:hypothetical protein